MGLPLFSTYRGGENRVTGTILAVFSRLSFSLTERLLQALCQEPESALLTFENQVVGPNAVPDARVRASFAYWIETKAVPNAVNKEQIVNHLMMVDQDTGVERKRLIVLTPDDTSPPVLATIDDPHGHIVWANFDQLLVAIHDVVEMEEDWLTSERSVASEYERGLLRDLARFLIATPSLVKQSSQDVLIVAGRVAWPDYKQYSAYLCQPDRSFRPTERIAFYTNGRIQRAVPKILHVIEHIVIEESQAGEVEEAYRPHFNELMTKLRNDGSERLEKPAKILFLSEIDSPDTHTLDGEIINDGKGAFTQGQRYVSAKRLFSKPKVTSQLIP